MAFPLIPVAIGSMIVLFLAGRSSAKTKDDGGGGKGGGGDTGLRSRVIAGELPGAFAAKYSGDGGTFSNKWKELPAVNPGMHIVTQSQWRYTGAEWQASEPPGDADETRTIDWGLTPWADNQKVYLPASWKG